MIADQFTTDVLVEICLGAVGQEGNKTIDIVRTDWRRLLKAAIAHKVVPLFYHGLRRQMEVSEVPPDILNYTGNEAKKILAKNILTRGELVRLAAMLNANEIPYLMYKGVITAQHYYESIGMREFNDNDFLIRRDDLEKVREILATEAYRPIINYNTLGEIKISRYEKEISLVKPRPGGGMFEADVHWQLLKPATGFDIDYGSLAKGGRQIEIAGVEVSVLSPEHEFVVMCVHNGINDGWGTLKHLFDLHMLIVKNGLVLDWHVIERFAQQYGLTDILTYSMALCQRYLSTTLPPVMPDSFTITPATKKLVGRHTFHGEESDWEFMKRQIALNRGLRKIGIAWRLLLEWFAPNHADQEFLPLPNPGKLYPLYFLIKPLRLVVRGANERKFENPDITR